MDVEIKKQDGTSFTLSEHGIIVNDFIVEGIEKEDIYKRNNGLHGRFLVDSTYVKRQIVVPCFFVVDKFSSYQAQRDLLYEIVQSIDPFYIREKRRIEEFNYQFKDTVSTDYQEKDNFGYPVSSEDNHNNHFVTGKQYKVVLNNVLQPKQNKRKGNVELVFETTELPFAESIGHSLNLENGKSLGLWSSDMNISWNENDKRTYTFENIKKCRFYYYGNVAIDQFNMYSIVEITIKEKTNNFSWFLTHSKTMTIKNVTLEPGDIIKYDGLRTYKNGVPIDSETNLENPIIKPGFNIFEFNQVVRKVVFKHKFYFK